MRTSMKRAVAFAGAVVSAGALSLAMAAPAQATANDCATYLKSAGYIVGPKVKQACAAGAAGSAVKCADALIKIEVTSKEATYACKLAGVK